MREEMLAVADVHGWVLEIRPLLYIATTAAAAATTAATTTRLSVSDAGFTALLKTAASDGDRIIAVRVDDNVQSSSSVEALTLLQLFQGALS